MFTMGHQDMDVNHTMIFLRLLMLGLKIITIITSVKSNYSQQQLTKKLWSEVPRIKIWCRGGDSTILPGVGVMQGCIGYGAKDVKLDGRRPPRSGANLGQFASASTA